MNLSPQIPDKARISSYALLNIRLHFVRFSFLLSSQTPLIASIHLWNQSIENFMSSSPLGCDFVTSLLSLELLYKISKFQSNVTLKWPAGNSNIHVSQKKRNIHSLCICYLKVIEGQASLSTLFGTTRFVSTVHFFRIFWWSWKIHVLRSCERFYTIYFSLFLKIKSLDMLVWVYQIVA